MKIDAKVKFSPYDVDCIGNSGELQRALDIALEQIRGGERDNELLFVAAKIAFRLQNLAKAEQLATLLLASDSGHINGWLLYGQIHLAKGDANRGAYGEKRAEEIFPGLAQTDIVRQLNKPQVNKPVKAKVQSTQSTDAGFDTATFAEICIQQWYLSKALKIYGDLLTKNPGDNEIIRRIEAIKRKMAEND